MVQLAHKLWDNACCGLQCNISLLVAMLWVTPARQLPKHEELHHHKDRGDGHFHDLQVHVAGHVRGHPQWQYVVQEYRLLPRKTQDQEAGL